jgi:heme/copper-type cytochrome/quinol oxidase subunit 2
LKQSKLKERKISKLERRKKMRTLRLIVVIAAVVALSLVTLSILSSFGYFKPSQTGGHVDRITIYEEDPPAPLAGMNGSYYKSPSVHWPVITVHQGDTVIITVINTNSSEVHGFAIDSYDPTGVATAPGHENTISFVANKVGSFRIYCNVVCAIHPLMQNGELIVSSS